MGPPTWHRLAQRIIWIGRGQSLSKSAHSKADMLGRWGIPSLLPFGPIWIPRIANKAEGSTGSVPMIFNAVVRPLNGYELLETSKRPTQGLCQALSSSSKVFASFRSSVPKPSVNQP
jgi:hypothetical protein